MWKRKKVTTARKDNGTASRRFFTKPGSESQRHEKRLTTTHVRRWHLHRHSVGAGHLYQGTYKSFPIETDEHLYTVLRYVERNPVRPTLVARAEAWRWSSLWLWLNGSGDEAAPALSAWPIDRPTDWVSRMNRALTKKEQEAVHTSVIRGRPFGDERWQQRTAKRLGLESTFRPRASSENEQQCQEVQVKAPHKILDFSPGYSPSYGVFRRRLAGGPQEWRVISRLPTSQVGRSSTTSTTPPGALASAARLSATRRMTRRAG